MSRRIEESTWRLLIPSVLDGTTRMMWASAEVVLADPVDCNKKPDVVPYTGHASRGSVPDMHMLIPDPFEGRPG